MQEKKGKIEDLIETYKKAGFNEGQLEEIKLGLEKGLDVSSYACSEFGKWQMEEIREGLKAGLDDYGMQNLGLIGGRCVR